MSFGYRDKFANAHKDAPNASELELEDLEEDTATGDYTADVTPPAPEDSNAALEARIGDIAADVVGSTPDAGEGVTPA